MRSRRNARLKINQSRNTSPAAERGRGRPREFDKDEALAQAMRIFWTLGYEAASMADLRAAMGITQASLYAAFGSKQQLFREAVELYRRTVGTTTVRALEDKATAYESVKAMLQDAAEAFTTAGQPAGCLVVLGAVNCSAESRAAQDYLLALRLRTPQAIADRIKRGQRDGDVPQGAPVEALAAYYTTVLHGLSVQARDGVSRRTLAKVVDCAMKVWVRMLTKPKESTQTRQ